MTNCKYKDWPVRLNEYILSIKDREFDWKTFSCVHLANGAINAQTGDDLLTCFSFDDKKEAMRILKDKFDGKLINALIENLGQPLPGVRGQKGDIAFKDDMCGVCLGKRSVFITKDEGLIVYPTRTVEYVFRI